MPRCHTNHSWLEFNHRRYHNLPRSFLFRSNWALWLPKTNAGSSTIFCDELNSGSFECGLIFVSVSSLIFNSPSIELNAFDGFQRDVRGRSQFCLPKPQYRAGPANLTGRKHFALLV